MLACFHLDVVKGSSRDGSGCCALYWAAAGGHLPLLQYLIQDGCEAGVSQMVHAFERKNIISLFVDEK